MRISHPTLRDMIEDLLHRQLCAWELLTVAADGAPDRVSQVLRTQARTKRVQVRELYELLRKTASRVAASHVPVENCNPIPMHEDLAGLLAALADHERETIRACQAALGAATPLEGDVLARHGAATRQSLSTIQSMRSVRGLRGRSIFASQCEVTEDR